MWLLWLSCMAHTQYIRKYTLWHMHFKFNISIYSVGQFVIMRSEKPDNREVYYGRIKKWLLKIDNSENTEILLICYVISKEILVSENFASILNEMLKLGIKCTNAFKLNIKWESLLKKFCDGKNGDHITILFHTDISWQRTTKLFLFKSWRCMTLLHL